jgi:glutaredoxin/uncharacterized protein (DUF302 family)
MCYNLNEMKLAYFRKSKLSKEEILERFKEFAEKNGVEILGQKDYKESGIVLLSFVLPNFLNNLKMSKEAFIFIPFHLVIIEKNGETSVGILNPEILNLFIEDKNKVEEIENFYKKMMYEIGVAGERKISKIKLYATTTCPYCKAEKNYLDLRGINYEYLLVDLNPLAAQEMVEKTGQMGVPVTEIIYDDGDYEFIIGYDKERLDKVFKNY